VKHSDLHRGKHNRFVRLQHLTPLLNNLWECLNIVTSLASLLLPRQLLVTLIGGGWEQKAGLWMYSIAWRSGLAKIAFCLVLVTIMQRLQGIFATQKVQLEN